MPRPCKTRIIGYPPRMKSFIPSGMSGEEIETIILQFDEFEALRLVEYEHLSQEEVAKKMDVSRPTLTRIYNSALGKIAQAFVEGRSIHIGGGYCRFDKDWHRCRKCHKLVENPDRHSRCRGCKSYGKGELVSLNDFSGN